MCAITAALVEPEPQRGGALKHTFFFFFFFLRLERSFISKYLSLNLCPLFDMLDAHGKESEQSMVMTLFHTDFANQERHNINLGPSPAVTFSPA